MNVALGPALVSVEKDPDASDDDHTRMVLGISAADRPGLLHDISKSLNRLKVQCLHSEASAVGGRSVSIWRIVALDPDTNREEIRAVVRAIAGAHWRPSAKGTRPNGYEMQGENWIDVG